MSTPYLSIWTGPQVDEGITRAYAAKAQLDLTYEGTLDLANGVEAGSVTGLGLGFTPARAFLQIEIPANGLLIGAWPVRDSLTANGFNFQLSGLTDSINYRLHYRLTGDLESSSSASSSG